MNIMVVDPAKIDDIWPRVIKNIQLVIDTQSKHNAVTDNILSIEGTREHIKAGHGLFLVIFESEEIIASLMLEVLNTEVGKSLNITTLGGTRIHEWNMLLLYVLKELANKYKCDDIRIYLVRKGWIKAMKPYGFKLIGNRDYCGDTYPCLSYNIKENTQ